MTPRWKLVVAALACVPMACSGQAGEAASSGSSPVPASTDYAFHDPDARFELDKELDEISGLTVLGDGLLVAVQDEKARLFVLRAADGAIVQTVRFGKKGDFEGVERAGESLFAVRSDGMLFRMRIPRPDDVKVEAESLETPLTERHNTEGLAYDPVSGRLLIACKDYPGKGFRNQRALYRFDPASGSLDLQPAHLIDLDSLESRLSRPPGESTLRTILRRTFNSADFRPSALAIHPQTGRIWVLSSTLKVLVELDDAGSVAAVHELPDERMRQPEGLAIDADGTVYVASEKGKGGGSAALYVFHRRHADTPASALSPDQ